MYISRLAIQVIQHSQQVYTHYNSHRHLFNLWLSRSRAQPPISLSWSKISKLLMHRNNLYDHQIMTYHNLVDKKFHLLHLKIAWFALDLTWSNIYSTKITPSSSSLPNSMFKIDMNESEVLESRGKRLSPLPIIIT